MTKSVFEQIVDRSITTLTADDLKGLTSIGKYSLSRCEALTSIEIPNTVKIIDEYSFYYCSNLQNITIPNSVTSINTYAFAYSGLTSITIPDSVINIKDEVFRNSEKLESVNLPTKISELGDGMFTSCKALTSITIPDNVTSIKRYGIAVLPTGFCQFCDNLVDIQFSKNMPVLSDSMFADCISLTTLEIPNYITTIGKSAFDCCTALTTVTIGSSVQNIKDYAFANDTGAMAIANAYFRQPSGMTVTLPTAGSGTGMFRVKTARNMNVYTDNETIKNYDWASDNITPTFYHLDGTAWA